MRHDSNEDTLPKDDEAALKAIDIEIVCIPKPDTKTSFYDLTMNKIRILSLIQYRRVMYLDASIFWAHALSEGRSGVQLHPA